MIGWFRRLAWWPKPEVHTCMKFILLKNLFGSIFNHTFSSLFGLSKKKHFAAASGSTAVKKFPSQYSANYALSQKFNKILSFSYQSEPILHSQWWRIFDESIRKRAVTRSMTNFHDKLRLELMPTQISGRDTESVGVWVLPSTSKNKILRLY